MSLEKIRLLCSAVSHMPLIFTFRDSGVTEKYGFELEVDIAGFDRQGKPPRRMSERASLLLDGEYEFLSGCTIRLMFIAPKVTSDSFTWRRLKTVGMIA